MSESNNHNHQNKAPASVEAILEMSVGATLALDEEGQVTHANSLAEKVLGIPTASMIGASLSEFVVDEYCDLLDDSVADASESPRRLIVRLASGLTPVEVVLKRADSVLLAQVRSMTQEFRMSAKAAGELTHDQLTGLPDQYYLYSELLHRYKDENGKPMALVAVWVDELETLITSHGQAAVDRVLREVSERVQIKLRAPDLLGRMQTAGFISILTTDASHEELTEIADRLRAEVAFPVVFDEKLVSFSASVAVANLSETKPSAERIMTNLEASISKSRENGGNRTEVIEFA